MGSRGGGWINTFGSSDLGLHSQLLQCKPAVRRIPSAILRTDGDRTMNRLLAEDFAGGDTAAATGDGRGLDRREDDVGGPAQQRGTSNVRTRPQGCQARRGNAPPPAGPTPAVGIVTLDTLRADAVLGMEMPLSTPAAVVAATGAGDAPRGGAAAASEARDPLAPALAPLPAPLPLLGPPPPPASTSAPSQSQLSSESPQPASSSPSAAVFTLP